MPSAGARSAKDPLTPEQQALLHRVRRPGDARGDSAPDQALNFAVRSVAATFQFEGRRSRVTTGSALSYWRKADPDCATGASPDNTRVLGV
jgi:hypothetical protein